jgi:subfamily B ATP-binding cassette protein MsbA
MKEFFRLLKPYKKKLCLALFAILVANALGLIFPWAIKLILDEVIIRGDTFFLNIVVISLVFSFILKTYFSFTREYLISFVGENVVCDLRAKLYAHIQKLSVAYVENTSTGKIISGIIGDVESIRNFLFSGVTDFIYSFFNVFFVLTILFFLDWRLTLISLIYLPVFGITFFKFTPYLKNKHNCVRAKYAELTSRLSETLGAVRVVAGFARGGYEYNRFNLQQREIFRVSMASYKLGILLWVGSEFISSLGLVTLIWFGARAVFTGRITIGSLMAFYSYLGMLFFPIIKMVIVNNYYQEAAASMERINEILKEEPVVKEAGGALRLDEIRGNIEFKGVSFGYGLDREILSDINLNIKESEVIALVGRSGVGKSTFINLLLRFYEPTRGKICIDGCNLKDLELKSYRSQIAMVLQDDYLFSTTVKENIRYGSQQATDEQIIQVAELASAHEFIRELSQGYNTQIGERGVKLSYGQRQRISIARAILRDPAILILDEATSNVDSGTERLIVERAFKELMRGRNVFIVAHRLSTIEHADRIIFIEDRKIAEIGNHYQLLEEKGDYWQMWMEQNNMAQRFFSSEGKV